MTKTCATLCLAVVSSLVACEKSSPEYEPPTDPGDATAETAGASATDADEAEAAHDASLTGPAPGDDGTDEAGDAAGGVLSEVSENNAATTPIAGQCDGASCCAAEAALTAPGLYRKVIPFKLVGAGAELPEGCEAGDSLGDVRCEGVATVSVEESGPTLTLDSGARFVFAGTASMVRAPSLSEGQEVHVTYTKVTESDPYSGSWASDTLVIHDGDSSEGELLFAGREGDAGEGPEESWLSALPAAATPSEHCQTAWTYSDCYLIKRVTFDQVLATTEETRLVHGERATLTTDHGTLDVVWAASMEESIESSNCEDGGPVTSDAAFALSRNPQD